VKQTSLFCLTRMMQVLNIAIYMDTVPGEFPWAHHLRSTPACPSRPEPRNLYILAPTVGTHFTQESGQSSYYQTSSYQKPTGSQVKTTEAQVSKISEFSTQYSVKICREISKYLQTCLFSSIFTRNIWLCHTYSHYFQNTSQFSHMCIFA
jgi:hypothetical protein